MNFIEQNFQHIFGYLPNFQFNITKSEVFLTLQKADSWNCTLAGKIYIFKFTYYTNTAFYWKTMKVSVKTKVYLKTTLKNDSNGILHSIVEFFFFRLFKEKSTKTCLILRFLRPKIWKSSPAFFFIFLAIPRFYNLLLTHFRILKWSTFRDNCPFSLEIFFL